MRRETKELILYLLGALLTVLPATCLMRTWLYPGEGGISLHDRVCGDGGVWGGLNWSGLACK